MGPGLGGSESSNLELDRYLCRATLGQPLFHDHWPANGCQTAVAIFSADITFLGELFR